MDTKCVCLRMACGSVDSDFVFRLFTKCPDDPVTLVVDVRAYKYFKRCHVNQAFCVRLSANGEALMVKSTSQGLDFCRSMMNTD